MSWTRSLSALYILIKGRQESRGRQLKEEEERRRQQRDLSFNIIYYQRTSVIKRTVGCSGIPAEFDIPFERVSFDRFCIHSSVIDVDEK